VSMCVCVCVCVCVCAVWSVEMDVTFLAWMLAAPTCTVGLCEVATALQLARG
jgi:hypothetical protein